MRWRTLRWWLAGLAVYLLFLSATFPAVYAFNWWHKHLTGVQLTGISGSVWSGSAQELVYKGQSWGGLEWHFDWLAPFSGHLGYHLTVQSAGESLSGRVTGNRDSLLLQDVHGHAPVSLFELWLPLPSGSLSGSLEVNLSRLLLVNLNPTEAEGVVKLSGVSLSWPESIALGDYQLTLTSKDKNGIQGNFMDTGGPLMLQGILHLAPNGFYQISGTLSSRDPSDNNLNTLIGYLPANREGRHAFRFTGNL